MIMNKDRDRINNLIYHACASNGVESLAKEIRFQFTRRYKRAFAKAFSNQKLIVISMQCWEIANHFYRDNIIIHESCHIIVNNKFGYYARGHGEEWKAAHKNAGFIPIEVYNL